jgi:hypothetical protein
MPTGSQDYERACAQGEATRQGDAESSSCGTRSAPSANMRIGQHHQPEGPPAEGGLWALTHHATVGRHPRVHASLRF